MPPDESQTGGTQAENPNPDYVHPQIAVTKKLRKDLDASLQTLKDESTFPKGLIATNQAQNASSDPGVEAPRPRRNSRERSLAITKIQEAIMWLGMDLKAMKDEGLGGENPYPQSYNPASPAIEPTADGLKL